MDSPRITYTPRHDAMPEDELNALVAIYRLIIGSENERGRLPDKSGPDDGIKFKEDSANALIIQE
jgi:hypothetical protein